MYYVRNMYPIDMDEWEIAIVNALNGCVSHTVDLVVWKQDKNGDVTIFNKRGTLLRVLNRYYVKGTVFSAKQIKSISVYPPSRIIGIKIESGR